jgi:hypothetical protein
VACPQARARRHRRYGQQSGARGLGDHDPWRHLSRRACPGACSTMIRALKME